MVPGARSLLPLFIVTSLVPSDVAHKGTAEVESFDVEAMQDMARGVVTKILTAPSLQAVSDGVEMRKIFRTMKYACPAI
jgi:hypothetical protein